jgi:hypothetical protein
VDPNLETSRCYISELHLRHLGRSSRRRSSRYDDTSVLLNSVMIINIPRSPSLIGANISLIFTPRRKFSSQPGIKRLPRYGNTSDFVQPCYDAMIFRDLLVRSERTCLRYHHLGGLVKVYYNCLRVR